MLSRPATSAQVRDGPCWNLGLRRPSGGTRTIALAADHHRSGRTGSGRRTDLEKTGSVPTCPNSHSHMATRLGTSSLQEVADRACVGAFLCASARASGINFRAPPTTARRATHEGSNRVRSATAYKRRFFSILEGGICGGAQPAVPAAVERSGVVLRHRKIELSRRRELT